jgi:hypothetical protein
VVAAAPGAAAVVDAAEEAAAGVDKASQLPRSETIGSWFDQVSGLIGVAGR